MPHLYLDHMMANDNLKREEKSPDTTSLSHKNEELDSRIVNEGADFSRTFHDHNGTGANTMAFPYKLLSVASPSCVIIGMTPAELLLTFSSFLSI